MNKPSANAIALAMEMQAPMGHNNPPTPFDDAARAVDEVWTEATHWLDGAAVQSQAEADAVAKLLDLARKAKKQADESRKADAKPFDDGKAAVQARYKPLLDRCDLIAGAAKKAVAPFLAAQEAAKREAERKAREKVEEAMRIAQAEFAAAKTVEERARAEEAAAAAKQADIEARVAAKDRGQAKGGARAVTLRTVKRAEVRDLQALMRWVWNNDRSALAGWADGYAAAALRAGQTEMDGVVIISEQVAV